MLNHKPDAVLFDLDGTLLDSAPDFIYCLNLQRQRHQMPPLEPGLIRQNVSNGARALINLGFNQDLGDPQYDDLRAELLAIYFEELGKRGPLFNGMDELLHFLTQFHIPWGIVTNKPRRFSDKLLDVLHLRADCGVLICPDDLAKSKPDPEGLFKAAKALNAQPAHCIYVGDHRRDIEAGKNAGMTTVSARYGYLASPKEAEEWEADLIIDHPLELKQIILKMLN